MIDDPSAIRYDATVAKTKGAPAQRRARAARGQPASDASDGQRHLASIDVDCHSEDNYLFSYLHDSALTGVFVRTLTPEAQGTAVAVRLLSPGPGGRPPRCELELEGEVLWVNAYRPSAPDNLHPGMGIRLLAVDEVTRARLLALLGRFAVLS